MADKGIKVDVALVEAVTLLAVAVFGNIAIIDVHIMGAVPTYYRIFIPILFVSCLFWNISEKQPLILAKDSWTIANKVFFGMGLLWVLYGIISLLISPWSSFGLGAKELMCIIWGFLSVYVLITLCMKGKIESIVCILKIILTLSLVLGYVEVFTGWHMHTSMLNDATYLAKLTEVYPDVDLDVFKCSIATGIFYNPNDYCAFLTILAPLCFFYKKDRSIPVKALHYAGIALIFMMLLIDDSFICTIAFALGLLFYLFFTKASWKQWLTTAVVIIAVRLFGNAVVNFVFQLIPGGAEIQLARLSAMLSAQVANMAAGSGSLLYRINTYTISISETFTQSKGLGLGAGSFSEYFSKIATERQMMSNPHSLWIEILSQYGVIVFLLVVAAFIFVFIGLFKAMRTTENNIPVMVMSMGICFIIACFAPSSFLRGSYYWIIFGLALGVITTNKYQLKEQNI